MTISSSLRPKHRKTTRRNRSSQPIIHLKFVDIETSKFILVYERRTNSKSHFLRLEVNIHVRAVQSKVGGLLVQEDDVLVSSISNQYF